MPNIHQVIFTLERMRDDAIVDSDDKDSLRVAGDISTALIYIDIAVKKLKKEGWR